MFRLLALTFFIAVNAYANKPLVIGLDADMSSRAAEGGVSIQQGAEIAISEINQNGGVLGRPLKLMVKDHRGNPARGVDNLNQFAKEKDLVAVLGGVHTPVALQELETIHKHQLIYLGPWAAGTPIVDNGYSPNYVFRVSVRDQLAGGFLVGHAKTQGVERVALFLERTGWGRSNDKSMTAATSEQGVEIVQTTWFNWGETEFEEAILSAKSNGAQAILLVANAPEGASIANAMAKLVPKNQLPIISHWGIAGGAFVRDVTLDKLLSLDLYVLQTFAFCKTKEDPNSQRVFELLESRFRPGITPKQVSAAVGVAHAYDLVHLLAKAIEIAGTPERSEVRAAMESIPLYEGLVKTYVQPFSATDHEGLDASDFFIGRYTEEGFISPL